MRITGLCGGIGAGKSTVATLFAEHGAHLIDVDLLGRLVIEPGGRAYASVIELFGEGILAEVDDPQPPIDRAKLAAIVFSDPADLGRLERVSHPAIDAELDARLDEALAAGHSWVVLDMAVLVESRLGRDLPSGRAYDRVVVVEAPEATRIGRLVEARGMDPDDAARRIASQADDATRRAVADIILVNDGNLDQLRRSVDAVIAELRDPT
ncbi:MAG: dephospho-CoA kinase [Actinomycetota bacterium]